MNKKVIKSMVESIFNVVKENVIMNIKSDLDDIKYKNIIIEDESMITNIVENYNRILDYYDDEYLMSLINDYLSSVIVEEEDILVFGMYNIQSIREVIEAIVEKIREIGCPVFVTSIHRKEKASTFSYIAVGFDNFTNGKYFVELAYRDIFSHWALEEGYKNEIECKLTNKQFIEEDYFEEYIKYHKDFFEFLYRHALTIEQIESKHIKNNYPYLY